jgi:hypothetical protein
MVYWYCESCEHAINKPPKWLPHDLVSKFVIIDNLPVIGDYSQNEHCAVCGKPGTEYHHWAPRHKFGDEADSWPGAYLCKKHHDQWHQIVTPTMCIKPQVNHERANLQDSSIQIHS